MDHTLGTAALCYLLILRIHGPSPSPNFLDGLTKPNIITGATKEVRVVPMFLSPLTHLDSESRGVRYGWEWAGWCHASVSIQLRLPDSILC